MPKPRTKKPTPIDIPSGTLRVWWIPQVPGPRFYVLASPEQAQLVLTTLARYESTYLEDRGYANAGGLEVFEDGEWCEWNNDEGQDIDAVMHQEAV